MKKKIDLYDEFVVRCSNMYTEELIELLENLLNKSYDNQSQKKNNENNEYNFHCRFCNNPNKKFKINLKTEKWYCQICNISAYGINNLLQKINAPYKLIKKVKTLLTSSNYILIRNNLHEKQDSNKNILTLPKEYKPLWVKSNNPIHKDAVDYLNNRGIHHKDLLKYSIGYCDAGYYRKYIIFPSYDKNGKLNYFVPRSIFPVKNYKLRYKNPIVSRNIVAFETLINWKEPIVLCEGVFDAITIRNNAIPLLGKFPTKTLINRLLERQVKTIYIALDRDATKEAIILTNCFLDSGIEAHLVEMTDTKDPAELGFTKFWELIQKKLNQNEEKKA